VIIACPNCSTGYLLPEHLVGPGGARVRCPRCQHLFAVDVDGLPRVPAAPTPGAEAAPAPGEPPVETAEAGGTTPAAAPGAPPPEGALAVARAVLEQLAVHEGEAIERARAEHRFFAEFGPALMVAYETYQRRAGEGADPGAFRKALHERWGLELVPLETREG
jgi:predicted Zn finger-like uncharacterized protein